MSAKIEERKRRSFLTQQMPLERVAAEVGRVLNRCVEDPSTLTLPAEEGAYLVGAGVAVERKRGKGYQTPQYLLATETNGSLTAKAYAWMELNGLLDEAQVFNEAQINRYIRSEQNRLRLRRAELSDEIAFIDADLHTLSLMLLGF